MNLPNRLYYPLELAAKELGCTSADLIHFGATSNIEICIQISTEMAQWFECSQNDCEIIKFNSANKRIDRVILGKYVRSEFNISEDNVYVYELFGLLAVDPADLMSFDISPEVPINLVPLHFPSQNFDKESGIEGYGDLIFRDIENLTLSSASDRLFMTQSEVERIKNGNEELAGARLPQLKLSESDKTLAKKAQLIPALLKMIPELNDVDLDKMPVSKIVNIIESLASKKAVDLPETHIQTWAKYLGRR